ncbi:hypothetical protein [Bacillus sp. Bva_UNVM-123]|uniref:hypothetical protein n=1 Tax=Bacillus sp. Bva_UNVM-123 TaxID=2829798 RepID=UPI00391EF409
MKKFLVILSVVLLSIHINNHQVVAEKLSGNLDAQSEQPDCKLIYDTLITSLEPSIQKEIIN